MSNIPAIIYYDGELIVDDEYRPKYIGGKRKGSKLKKHCSFVELKRCVYDITKIDHRSFDLKLVCKWVRDDGSSAADLSDDDDMHS